MDGKAGDVENSMEASDPFGLSSLARRRRLPVSLEPYLTPRKPNSQTRQGTMHESSSPVKKENRITLETMSSSTSLLTTPISNRKNALRDETSPAATWNVSRISPQETVSVISMADDVHQEQHQKRGGVDNSMASQAMRQQMLQLVHSLQTNLSESQEIRSHQQVELRRAQHEISTLQKQVHHLQEEGQEVRNDAELKLSAMDQKLQDLVASSREKDILVSQLQQQLLEKESEAQKVNLSLQNLRLEHASLSQSLTHQSESHRDVEDARMTLEQERRDIERDRQLLKQEQERWHEEHKDLREQSLQVESQAESLKQEASILAKERAQVKSLQQQLLELQMTQMEVETAHNEEEDRLVQIATALDARVQEIHRLESGVLDDRRRLEARQHELEENMLHREAEVKEALQGVLSQQKMLESWDTTLRERRAELDDKTKELSAIEANLRQKGQELSRIIHERREELEEKSRSVDAKHVLTMQAVEDLTSRRLEEESRLETAISNMELVQRQHEEAQMNARQEADALALSIQEAQEEYDEIQKLLSKGALELEDLKQQTEELREESAQNGHEFARQQQHADEKLRELQTEIKDAESLKASLHIELLSAKGELEKAQYLIEQERNAWEHDRQVASETEYRLQTQRREAVDQEIRQARELAETELTAIVEEANSRQDILSRELMEHMDQIDRMRGSVENASKSWTKKHDELERDRQECKEQQRRLDQLVLQLENARADQKTRRAELDLERQRLHKLLEEERQRHEDELDRLSHDSTVYMQRIRQQHVDEVAELTRASDSQRSECEEKVMALRAQLSHLELQHQEEVASFTAKTATLESELAATRRQASEGEAELKHLRQQLANLNSSDMQEREKIRLLIDRLETSNANLSSKEAALANRERELQGLREQIRRETEDINESKDELQCRIRDIQTKENELSQQKTNFDLRVSQMDQQELQVNRKLRRMAMKNLIHTSWREDKEVVSAAFSKWLRVTMMESAAEGVAIAEQGEIDALRIEVGSRDDMLLLKEEELATKDAELHKTRAELSEMVERCSAAAGQLSNLNVDLDRLRSALRLAEERLERNQLQSETHQLELREQLKKEREELTRQQQQLQSDRAALSQLDKFLKTKQSHLNELECRAPKEVTVALERKIAEQQKVIDKTQAELEAAQEELATSELGVLERAQILEGAEQRLLEKEQRLSADVFEFKRAEAKVLALAEQLRIREASITDEENRFSRYTREFEEAHERVRTMARELAAEKRRLGLRSESS